VPEWAAWFNHELTRHGMIQALVGLGCSPVLVRGSKESVPEMDWQGMGAKPGLAPTNAPLK
jgi:hypothetical protein